MRELHRLIVLFKGVLIEHKFLTSQGVEGVEFEVLQRSKKSRVLILRWNSNGMTRLGWIMI